MNGPTGNDALATWRIPDADHTGLDDVKELRVEVTLAKKELN
jgi:hypothetical protein